jgi:hypothetical protein
MQRAADHTGMEDIALSGVIGTLSYALDITEGQPPGHALRCSAPTTRQPSARRS